jgi:single-stranded DNA-specific DHH superfamily exonuclease
MLSKYNKPTILLRNYTTDKIKEYRGSIRSKPVEGMPSFKDALEGITGVDFVAGHDNAAGIGINQDAIAEFKSHLYSILDDLDFNSNLYIVDLISDYDKLNIENARVMGRDDIWGHGVDKPQVVINNAPIDKYELMGKEQEHLKIDCGKYDVVLFNVPELTKKLLNGEKYDINIIGEFDIDKAYNIGRLQCIANDYELSEFTPRNPMMDLVF